LFKFLQNWFATPTLSSFESSSSRDRLVQSGRIVFIDDESPLLIDELKRSGFAIDHDKTGNDLRNFDNQLYDVAIIDYHGVGDRIGSAQGLDLLKYIRRVSPRTRLIAYTSRSLNSAESEFFRLSHVVLPKDFGLGDSLALIEGELRKAFSKEYLFDALVSRLNVAPGTERDRMQKELIKALSKKDENRFKEFLVKTAGAAAEKGVSIILGRLFVGK
jgi:hypothetical protein